MGQARWVNGKDGDDGNEAARQVHHDIRSPLSVIAIVASKLSHLDPEATAALMTARERIEQMAASLVDRKARLTASASELLESLHALLNEKMLEYPGLKADIAVKMDGASDAQVDVDRGTFGRIASNLVNNAVEAGAARNSSGIFNCSLKVTMTCADGWFSLAVRDSGQGIAEEVLQQIGSTPVTTKQEGSGLGLYGAQLEVHKRGGCLHIASCAGKGTLVTVRIPVVKR